MPDRTVSIRLSADAKSFVTGVKVAQDALDRFDRTARGAQQGSDRLAQGMSAATIANARLTQGMSAAGAAARRQASAANQAAAANRGLARGFLAAHQSLLKYVGGGILVGELYAQLRRVPSALRETADAYTELNNRLRLVTGSETQLVAVRHELLGLSQRTRTELTANAELYSRIALASTETGHSQTELLRVTELLNQQVAIGGNTAAEAAAGLTQFAQGLAAGRLQGDELRSVLENLQGVSEGLLTGFRLLRERGQIDFDVTRANIRDLAAEGVLSSKLLLDAILASADDTERKFGDVATTVKGAAQEMANAFTVLIGRIDEATGVSEGLAAALSNIASDITDRLSRTAYDVKQEIIDLEAKIAQVPEVIRLIPAVDQSYQRQLAALRTELAALMGDAPARSQGTGFTPVTRRAPVQRAGLTAPSAFETLSGAADAPRNTSFGANRPVLGELDLSAQARRQQEQKALAERETFNDQLRALDIAHEKKRRDAVVQEIDLTQITRAHSEREAEMSFQADIERIQAEAQQRRLGQARAAHQLEMEARRQEFEERLAQAQGFADVEAQQQALREEAILALKYRSQQELARILILSNRLQYQQGVQALQTGLQLAQQGFQALAGQSKAAFRAYQATAIAQTVISTYQGAQDAYASGLKVAAPAPIPQIIAVASAAAAIAAGIGRVNAIRSQRPPQAYAAGGVVDSPTFFSARGVPSGVAGEAGPEAILPLRRGRDGRLGVAAGGSQPMTLTVNTEINVQTQGELDDAAVDHLARRLERSQEQAALRVLRSQQRPGGVLNRTETVV